MKCPHCLVEFYVGSRTTQNWGLEESDTRARVIHASRDVDGHWWIEKVVCPSCRRCTLRLISSQHRTDHVTPVPMGVEHSVLIRPRAPSRPPIPPEVPYEFRDDYLEACLVLVDSPKASAALSRRCLQLILRERAAVKNPNDLAKAIQEVVDDPTVPSGVSDCLDLVRNIGNFAAHPNKSQSTGEIVPVEDGEAEWCLEAIEVLFDFYFVQPAKLDERGTAFNQKLNEAGKPPMPATTATSLKPDG